MQLVKFELSKILAQKSIYISFLILLGLTLTEQVYPSGPMNSIVFVNPLLTGMMLLIGLAPVFTKEYSSGVDQYIFSSKKGRKELGWAKICASLIYSFMVIFVWEIINLSINFVRYGIEGWGDPIQTLLPYSTSEFNLSLLDFHLIQLVIHLLGAFGFTLVILVVSSVSKNSLVSFVISLFILAVPSLEFMDEIKISVIAETLPYAIFNYLLVQPFFADFKTVEIFGFSMAQPIFACFIMVIVSNLLVYTVLRIMKNKEVPL